MEIEAAPPRPVSLQARADQECCDVGAILLASDYPHEVILKLCSKPTGKLIEKNLRWLGTKKKPLDL